MTWVAGVDGCRGGWLRICRRLDDGALRFDLVEGVADLWRTAPHPAIVAIDMPIGLPEAGPRACDRAARALLGPRRSSVFPAPVRAALPARSHAEASRIGEAIDGRRMSAQAWHLTAKIRALDAALDAPDARAVEIREVHPELSFRAWNGGRPMAHPKRTPAGRAERLALAETWLGPALLRRGRGSHPRRLLADDDVLDAVATLWTAHRLHAGRAERLPATPPRDAAGRRMEIVY